MPSEVRMRTIPKSLTRRGAKPPAEIIGLVRGARTGHASIEVIVSATGLLHALPRAMKPQASNQGFADCERWRAHDPPTESGRSWPRMKTRASRQETNERYGGLGERREGRGRQFRHPFARI